MFLQGLSLLIVSSHGTIMSVFFAYPSKSDCGIAGDLEDAVAYHGSSSAILRSL